jgi:ubiquinone/menaquinone biosynthesis C-methylase UbiE
MTEKNDYWVNFWNTNSIVDKASAHEKVGRTIAGVPIAPEKWQAVLDDLEEQMELKPEDRLLDIGAGSGVISIPFSKKVKQVTALDVSEKLLAEMQNKPGITTMVADARDMEFEPGSFNKVVVYFAIQHFTEEETVKLMLRISKWLRPGGILYVGDIPDVNNKFLFFSKPEWQKAYFDSLVNASPAIGTWFHPDFFKYLGAYAGFNSVSVRQQPAEFINAHYRFDARFVK